MAPPPLSAALRRDVEAVGKIPSIARLLKAVTDLTGLRYAVIARVTDTEWVACAVNDEVNFGLGPGGTLEVATTLCSAVRDTKIPVVFGDALADPLYSQHITPRLYGLRAYMSVPIFLEGGSYFGNVCALDPEPRNIDDPKLVNTLALFGELIALELARAGREAELHAATRRLEGFVMDAPAALALFRGGELIVELANERFQQLVGLRSLNGRKASEALHEFDRQGVLSIVEGVFSSGKSHIAVNHPIQLPSLGATTHTQVFLDWVAQPTRDEAGGMDGVMFFAVDVTDRVATRQALERRNVELDNFASVASHDLKSPLRGIAHLAEWIEEDLADHLTASGKDQFALLRRRVGHMSELIEGVLRYARAGELDTTLSSFELAALMDDLRELLEMPPGGKLEVLGKLPRMNTSRVALQQVLLNLVSNAFKHSGKLNPVVRITVTAEEDHHVFAVRDDGPGIAPEHHDRVWKLFQTLKADDTGKNTGIGLSIVKKIVEGRQGKVWLESTPGKGTTFFFTWPRLQLRRDASTVSSTA